MEEFFLFLVLEVGAILEQNTHEHTPCRVDIKPEIVFLLLQKAFWWLVALGRDREFELSLGCEELG